MSGKSVQHQYDSAHSGTASPANAAPAATARQPRGNAAMQEAIAAQRGCGHAHATGGGSTGAAAATKADAIRQNQQGIQAFERLITRGLNTPVDPAQGHKSVDNLFRNAAEWVDQGQADVVVLTPTHDSASRTTRATDVAYFDTTSSWRSGSPDYDETNLGDQAEIEIMNFSVLGTMSGDGKTLTMVDPVTKTDQKNIETLIHEVQHDADQHGSVWGEMPVTGSGEAPTWIYNSYMTEFRAYWLENPEGSGADQYASSTGTNVTNINIAAVIDDGSTVTVSTAFQNERQESIFNHLISPNRPAGDWWDYTNGEWSQVYAYVGYYYAADPAFKAFVDGHATPTAGNAIGSVRIQHLSEVLGAACGNVDMEALALAVRDLDELDHVYLADRAMAEPLWSQARASLLEMQYREFETMMTTCQ